MTEPRKWPEKLTYYHSNKGYPENCVEAANKMRDACAEALKPLFEACDKLQGLSDSVTVNLICFRIDQLRKEIND